MCCGNSYAQLNPQPPFIYELEIVNAPQLPGLHSYAKAQSGNKWLLLGGRVDGLHSFFPNSAFAPTEANQSIYVIDTNDWQVWTAPLSILPYQYRSSLSATNAAFLQDGDWLYVAGGYGYDSLTASKITLPTLTAIDYAALIDAIVAGNNNLSPYFRQLTDSAFAVTGGALQKTGNTYYLLGGQNFSGLYTKLPSTSFIQHYTNSISRFQLTDDGADIIVTNFTKQTDSINFHRRDFNAAPIMDTGGNESIVLYGGVFTYDNDLPYLNPVYITPTTATTDFGFDQKMSQYTCPVIPVFDSLSGTMYTTFFGGISLYDFNDSTGVLAEDTLVPFINDITTITRLEDGTTSETILPVKFPGLYGANAGFFPADFPHYDNGVFKLNVVNSKQLIGYIYGGINTNSANEGYSNASNQLFRVFLTPETTTSIAEISGPEEWFLFPNPASDYSVIQLHLHSEQRVLINLMNVLGTNVATLADEIMQPGGHQIYLRTNTLHAGIYFVQIRCADIDGAKKLLIIK